jgi:nicotinamide-nucleotide amidase
LYSLSAEVGAALFDAGLVLATAESCTGGWVAECITDVPGSSAWFDCGFVTYSNAAKSELLGVSQDLLKTHGAVSAAAVSAMAHGVLERSSADIALAVSGVAGPGGGTSDKPVGTVWFAWRLRSGGNWVKLSSFEGGRRDIRRHAVWFALKGILDACRP